MVLGIFAPCHRHNEKLFIYSGLIAKVASSVFYFPHPLYHNYSFYYQEVTPISLPLEFGLVLFTSVSNKMHQKRWCDIQGVRQRNLDSSDVSLETLRSQ